MNVVVGAGMGGLAAAVALARAGRAVTVVEARDRCGGLAGALEIDGRAFDGGPYILLDRPGLDWVFEELGERFDDHLTPIRLDEVYRVRSPRGVLRIYGDLARTAEGIERAYPGNGRRYEAFVTEMVRVYESLAPLQRGPTPRPWSLLGGGRWRHARFLLRSLGEVLRETELAEPVQDALGIWTHIAGQRLREAPSPLAFVPAIVHTVGAWTVRGGIGQIPLALEAIARRAGVRFRYGEKVERIPRVGRRVQGVVVDGQLMLAERVFANAAALSVLTELVDPPDLALSDRLVRLPLQSPGVCAYLSIAGFDPDVPFLEFFLPGGAEKVRLRIVPGVVDATRPTQARLVHPVDHAWATAAGEPGQQQQLEHVLAEPWWREGLTDPRVLATRLPVQWGHSHHLWRDSMNPVMTAAFMRRGRIPHHGLLADNLHLVGSATHPGQWVSFCAISGVVAVSDALRAGPGRVR